MSDKLHTLENSLHEIVRGYPFPVHWQVRDLATRQTVGEGEHEVLGAFSTRKVSVLLACLTLVKSGKLALDDTYVIDDELKDGVQAGIMRHLSSGIELSLRDHLAQMMITSDNICTQIVFRAIGEVTGDALQWVNDYCVQVGMRDSLHREIFPRSAELEWSHSIESMTVTSAHDQALILEWLARGSRHQEDAAFLGLTTQLCDIAIKLLSNLLTPMLGASLDWGHFAEKNGRGIRGLSQVGLLLDAADQPVASVAVFAESIPVEYRDGTPGRMRAQEMFVEFGKAIESFYLDTNHVDAMKRQLVEPDYWGQEFGDLLYAVEGGRAVHDDMVFTFSGVGKLFFACTLAELESITPGVFDDRLDIREHHRLNAYTGSLLHLSGSMRVTVDDAMHLMIGSGDGAATMALLEYFTARGIDIVEHGRRYVASLNSTTITGVEERSSGEGFTGTTTAADLLTVLRRVIEDDGRVKQWMSSVFEPDGLANALPGYGPHTVEHWTVSGWGRVRDYHKYQGRTSVLIIDRPRGPVGLAAHAPIGTQDVSVKFGSLGLAAYLRES